MMVAGGGLMTSATVAVSEPVGILDAVLWTVMVNGQPAVITGQSLVVVAGALVGIGALIVSIIKIRR